jgi:hypothetical protein
MSTVKPFIPRDKPRSWVIGVCAGLIGMAVGLVGFVFAWVGIKPIQAIAIFLFMVCWLTFALSWLVFAFRLLTGHYRNIQSKDWAQQIW